MDKTIEILIKGLNGLAPKHAIILGSGLGGLADALTKPVHIPFSDLPDFPQSGVSGHAGEMIAGYISNIPVVMLSGRIHYYEQGDAAAMRPILNALHKIGITDLILTNSAGSVRQDMPPGSVMQLSDHINLTGMNPLIGEESDKRFVGMSNAYDKDLSARMTKASHSANIHMHQGVYMWFSGPSFETPAEINMARILGADAVGMSTVPEVILARYYGMRVAAASIITNFAAGMTGDELSHDETKDMAPKGGAKMVAILKAMFTDLNEASV